MCRPPPASVRRSPDIAHRSRQPGGLVLCLCPRNRRNGGAVRELVGPKRFAMRVHFSTDGLPRRDRVRFWCDYFAQQVHSFTPDEIPDADAFHAEASGEVTGGFALLDIETGLERARRTRADVLRDKSEAVYIRRFHRPLIWRAAPRAPGSTSCTSLAISA